MKYFLLLFLMLIISIMLMSENLIPNPDFELWINDYDCTSWSGDSSSVFYITKESDTVFSGLYSIKANIFTTTQSSCDIISDTFAVIPGDTYDFYYNLFDNDPAANGRYYFYYFDSGKNYLGNYYGTYTSDNTIWQILSGEYVIPAGAYYLFSGFRFYDTGSWDGDAYIYIDSVYFGKEGGSPVNALPQFSSHQRTPSNPAPSETVYTSIIITDNSAVISDTMFYRLDAGTWNPIIRDSLVSDRYYYTLSGQGLDTVVDYYYKAIDDSSAASISDTFSYTVSSGSGVGLRILFDFTKEEDAGNADWIIDTNYPKPLPDDPTAEDDWLGAISYWGFELDSSGYVCRTLPPAYSITYGTADSMDLQNFDVFIIPEPQNPFSASEKSAIFDFVRNGGGLFMVADHNASDRNSSGWDSPRVFNDLGSKDSFGMHFDTTGESYNSISVTCTSFTGLDSIYNGKFGNAQGSNFTFHAGTTMPASTKAIEIAPYPFDASYSMLSVAYFGDGKVAGMGDSSPADDSTGQAGNTLYMGWEDGINRMLIMNTTWWLSINNITSQINSINTNYEIINDKIYIHVDLTNSSEFINIRLYKKSNKKNNYVFIDSKPSKNTVLFEDNINNNYGSIYYKITGINKNGKEIFITQLKTPRNNNIDIADNIITNGIIKIKSDIFTYQIIDCSGRTIQIGNIKNNEITVNNLNTGLYFLKANNNLIRFMIIK